MPRLYVSIAGHGYGHAGQTAPVIGGLRARHPDWALTIRSALPRAVLASHFAGAFEHIDLPAEVGMCMHNALDVDAQASYDAHLAFHRGWAARVEREAAELRARGVDLVVANASYLMTAAAARAGIPAVLLCSLNWADILLPYCAGRPRVHALYAQMVEAYNAARLILQLAPHMPMPALRRTRAIGPVARRGRLRRAEIAARLGLAEDERLVLVSMGGIAMSLRSGAWPAARGVRYVLPEAAAPARADLVGLDRLGMPYIDVLRSSDAVLTKPGYGTFAECACNGIPVLYVPRRDWPEEPHLIAWLRGHGRCAELDRAALESGALAEALRELWARPTPPAVEPDGIEQAVGAIETMLA